MTDIILPAGQSAMNLVLFIILPVMVVMLTLMRLLEPTGFLNGMVAKLAPLLRPFGLTGLGVFAALQVNLVSFAAPVATLAVMDRRGASDRHLAATLAMVCAMAQANASLPHQPPLFLRPSPYRNHHRTASWSSRARLRSTPHR